jgi:hypothetical protein
MESEKNGLFQTDDDKKFWMNLLKPTKIERNVIEKIRRKLRIIDTLNAFISFFSLLISQVEYETEYYPKMYILENTEYYTKYPSRTGESEYQVGQYVRMVVSAMCLLLCLLASISCILNYNLKREQRKIINSTILKNKISYLC